MTLKDVGGLLGVLLTLIAYAGATTGRLDPQRPLSLGLNLMGGGLILLSLLTEKFNLSATAMEGTWVLIAAVGLLRWGWAQRRR